MFTELIMAGGVLFWLLLAVASIFVLYSIENESAGWALFSTIVVFLAVFLFGDAWQYLKADPMALLWLVPGYIGLGLAWTVPRYYFLLSDLRDEMVKRRSEFLELRDRDPDGKVPKELAEDWEKEVARSRWRRYGVNYDAKTMKTTPPTFRANFERLTTWAVWWPWSAAWTLVRHPVKRVLRWGLEHMKAALQRMSHWVFRDFD